MLVIGGTLNIGCMNQAAVSVKDGHYEGNARSTNPEALLDTVSRNKARETYADTYRAAVERGGMYPYGNVGPVGDYRLYCPNGVCISPPAQPVSAPPPAAPRAPATPTSKAPAQKPVTREELEQVRAQAADAQKKADVSIGILKTVRTEKEKQKEVTPAAAPPPVAPPVAPPVTTPAQKPMSQQEIDEINRRAEEARKRADAATAAPAKQP
jgi:hypothetical protein